MALFSRPTRLSSSRSPRVIFSLRWQPAMAHLAGTFLGISPNITTTAQGGGSGHARRVRDWRGITAKGLVYPASDGPALERSKKVELALVGAGK